MIDVRLAHPGNRYQSGLSVANEVSERTLGHFVSPEKIEYDVRYPKSETNITGYTFKHAIIAPTSPTAVTSSTAMIKPLMWFLPRGPCVLSPLGLYIVDS